MDYSQATKVVYSRVQKLEPDYVTEKIIGYILLQEHPNREMIRLAFGPDSLIHNLIQKAKIELGLVSKPVISPCMIVAPVQDFPAPFTTILPVAPTILSPPAPIQSPSPYPQPMHNNTDFISFAYSDYPSEEYRLSNQHPSSGLEGQLEQFNPVRYGFPGNYNQQEAAFANLTSRRNLNSSNVSFPIKACHYFNKGLCKHGSNCRYFHGQSLPGVYHHHRTFGTYSSEDCIFSPGSLEKLEMEIVELLKLKRDPVSIASLPLLYFEKYGKVLQADGYLTECQRHGKDGYSLTKVLDQLNSIRLIDRYRPHGQHSVILAEDATKYAEIRSEREYPGPIVCGSRQIYLTFPAESTFSEGDVANYFSTFGPVEDVRIPFQQKRMFGFVTFVSVDTVKMILSKGNPHYVCGARVLVKPYREKVKHIDRKFSEKVEPPIYYHSHQIETDSEVHARWESSRSPRKQVVEEHEWALERMHLSELQNPQANQSDFHRSVEELQVSGQSKFLSEEGFCSILPDIPIDDSPCDANTKNIGSKYAEQESQALDLPDSPFASPVASSISTAILLHQNCSLQECQCIQSTISESQHHS